MLVSQCIHITCDNRFMTLLYSDSAFMAGISSQVYGRKVNIQFVDRSVALVV